ncbi:MAG: ABC transporter ATP-binding protein [Lachnospiraceae bacterium]|nr:ABC transporter ATP-binding protein [Lachnospiraceae bacterium]
MPNIILEHITKKFAGFTAVEDLNMEIRDSDFITLLGPSGCGKTTTLRMIAGLETPTSGRITIGDKVVFDAETGVNVTPDKRDVGFLFQNYALWPHMTVYQNIAFGLENLKWKKSAIEQRVHEMLALLKIEEFEQRYPSEISGGQQQRVAIARTLAPNPKVLFMDEPLSNLDAKLRAEMRTELKRLHRDTGATFVYVTHDQLEAMTLSSKVCLMSKGVIQQFDAPLTVYNRPANLFVADFVGNPTMNFIDCDISETNNGYTVRFLGETGRFIPREKTDLKHGTYVLGIRPELIQISDDGALAMSAYATLPTGLETTIKLKKGDTIISSIQFGSIDYEVDRELRCDIISDKICLFGKDSTDLVSMGSITF